MTLFDYADCMNLEIKLTRYPQQNSRWICQLAGVEVCQGERMLASKYGNAASPELAIADYIPQISGQRIKINNATYANVPTLELKND